MGSMMTDLVCENCRRQWRGLWDHWSASQPLPVKCPGCGSETARPVRIVKRYREPLPAQRLDSANHYGVCRRGPLIVIMHPPDPGIPISTASALNLAAWIVSLADPQLEQFSDLLAEIQNL